MIAIGWERSGFAHVAMDNAPHSFVQDRSHDEHLLHGPNWVMAAIGHGLTTAMLEPDIGLLPAIDSRDDLKDFLRKLDVHEAVRRNVSMRMKNSAAQLISYLVATRLGIFKIDTGRRVTTVEFGGIGLHSDFTLGYLQSQIDMGHTDPGMSIPKAMKASATFFDAMGDKFDMAAVRIKREDK